MIHGPVRILSVCAVFNHVTPRIRQFILKKFGNLSMHHRPCLFILAIATITSTSRADGFEVSGTVESVTTKTNRHTFYIHSDGPNVFIQCSAGTLDQSGGSEFGSDGINGFLLQKTLYQNVRGKTNPVVNDATMHIEPSPLPHWQAGAVRPVWLTFATALQLGKGPSGYLRPRSHIWIDEVNRDTERWELLIEHLLARAEWSFDSSTPHVLRRFVEFRDTKWDSERYSPDLIPAGLRNGRTNLLFEALAWTNAFGLHLPTEAQIISYQARSDDPDGPMRERMTTRLHVTHISRGVPRRSFIPEPRFFTHIIDYRFVKSPRKPAIYLSSEGVIYHTAEDAWAAMDRENNKAARRNSQKDGAK